MITLQLLFGVRANQRTTPLSSRLLPLVLPRGTEPFSRRLHIIHFSLLLIWGLKGRDQKLTHQRPVTSVRVSVRAAWGRYFHAPLAKTQPQRQVITRITAKRATSVTTRAEMWSQSSTEFTLSTSMEAMPAKHNGFFICCDGRLVVESDSEFGCYGTVNSGTTTAHDHHRTASGRTKETPSGLT